MSHYEMKITFVNEGADANSTIEDKIYLLERVVEKLKQGVIDFVVFDQNGNRGVEYDCRQAVKPERCLAEKIETLVSEHATEKTKTLIEDNAVLILDKVDEYIDQLVKDLKPVGKIARILIDRDGISAEDAEEQIKLCKERLYDSPLTGENAEDIIAEELGLEPDYFFDLM